MAIFEKNKNKHLPPAPCLGLILGKWGPNSPA